MPTEVNSLVLNVKSDTVGKATDRLFKFTKTTKGADKATDAYTKATKMSSKAQKGATATTKKLTKATAGFGMAVKGAIAPLVAMLGPLLAIKKTFSTTIEMQNWQAQLKTATGSVDAAADAFERLKEFASETPYNLGQSVEAFTKLKNLGLDPSEESMRSYGNTASAMGKDLSQMIEAVADATTGEFERLKEFGIKAKSQGDNVSLTFRGMTKTIKKSAKEIEGYLKEIGNTQFSGAMVDMMNTLGGSVSNLGDTWDELFRTVSTKGVGGLMKEGVQGATGAINALIDKLKSGELETSISSWTVGLEDLRDGFGIILGDIGELFGAAANDWVGTSGKSFTEILRLFKVMLSAMAKAGNVVSVELGTAVLTAGVAKETAVESGILLARKYLGQEKPTKDDAKHDKEMGKVITKAKKSIKQILQLRKDGYKEGEADFAASVDRIDTLTRLAAEKRRKHEEKKGKKRAGKANRAAVAGALPETSIQASIQAGIAEAAKAATQAAAEEEKKVSATSSALKKLRDEQKTEHQKRLDDRKEQYKEEKDLLWESVNTVVDANGKKLLSDEEYAKLSTERWDKYHEDISKVEKRTADKKAAADKQKKKAIEDAAYEQITATENVFSALEFLEQGRSEKSQRRKAAFAITSATINAYQGASQALKEENVGTYTKYANAAAIVLTGLGYVQQIKDAGSFATGGIVGGTSFTGDTLSANVNSSEMILNRQQQAQLFAQANGKGTTTSGTAGSVELNVMVENYGSSEITVERLTETDVRIIARDVVREDTDAVTAGNIGLPNSRTSAALGRSTNAQRRR